MNVFGEEDEVSTDRLSVLPLSVFELPVKPKTSSGKNYDKDSSRITYSKFPDEVCELVYELFLRDSKKILDPFAGWGERHYFAKKYDKDYTGFDLSPDAIEMAKENYNVTNTFASLLDTDIDSDYDGFFTCPPYWNLEVYSNADGLDKLRTWDDFLEEYEMILSKSLSNLKSGSKICIVVGDWRAKHVYYDLTFQTNLIFSKYGCKPIDNVVISRKNNTKIKILIPQCKRLGYTVKLHETLLVFEK